MKIISVKNAGLTLNPYTKSRRSLQCNGFGGIKLYKANLYTNFEPYTKKHINIILKIKL